LSDASDPDHLGTQVT